MANLHWLSVLHVLHMVIISFSAALCYALSFPGCVYKLVLHICVSVAALQMGFISIIFLDSVYVH